MTFFNFCFFFLLSFLSVFVLEVTSSNPWGEHMEIYDIPLNHDAGVNVDLGGIAKHPDGRVFRYSNGKCPVFSKQIYVPFKSNFLRKLNRKNLLEAEYLSEMYTGFVKFHDQFLFTEGLQFPDVETGSQEFKNWITPVKKDSLVECAKYINNFETLIEPKSDNFNCQNFSINHGICLKHNLIYDRETKLCYMLYPTFQTRELETVGYQYISAKYGNSPYVFGSTNIRPDWREKCVIRNVKGAVFGKWDNEKDVCEEMKPVENPYVTENISTVDLCGDVIFKISSVDDHNTLNLTHGVGLNWSNFDGETKKCTVYDRTPDCFIYKKSGTALTSTGLTGDLQFQLPPCISASEGWTVNAQCENDLTEPQDYTCKNGKWTNKDDVECHIKYIDI